MKYRELKIKGVYEISPISFMDNRGLFRRNFCKTEFAKNKINNNVFQANISENYHKYTLRGFHYQIGRNAEAKTITCINGKAFDIVVDLRKKSKTYLKWVGLTLSSKNRKSIHIPKGCANAFLTLEKNTIFHYYSSNNYDPLSERGVRYNDNLFNFRWPRKPKFISDKDMNWENFKS